jgi:ankyrin repeat protein
MNCTQKILKILLKKGAHANERARTGRTALMTAGGSPEFPADVESLLGGGADRTLKDQRSRTALVGAMESPRPQKVQLLKKALSNTH